MSIPSFNLVTRTGTYNIIINIATYPSSPPDFTRPKNKSMFVFMDRMKELKITTDLTSPIPYGHLIYSDRAGDVIDFIGNDNVFISISVGRYIDQHGPDSKSPRIDDNNYISHFFIVDKLEILDHTLNYDTIRIDFTSINHFLFSQNCVYSSNGIKELKTIITEIIGKHSPGIDFAFPVNYAPDLDGSRKINYTSSTNSTVMDSIEYVMDHGFDIEDGPSCLTYDLGQNKLYLWMQKYWDEDDRGGDISNVSKSIRYSGYIPSQQKYVSMEQLIFDEMTLKSFVSNTDVFDKTKTYNEKIFNFDSGEFENTRSKDQTAVLTSISPTSDNMDAVLLPKVKSWLPVGGIGLSSDSKFDYTRTVSNYGEILTRKLRAIAFENNVLCVKMNGWLLRTPGDPFVVLGNTDKKTQMSVYMLVGRWNVLRVSHLFRPNEYKNEIMLCRNEQIRDKTLIEYDNPTGP